MKDSLKDFIAKNREAFDDHEPREGSWSPISDSLLGMKERTLWNSLVIWRVAAVLLLGLSVYFFSTREGSAPLRKEMANVPGDFSDLEVYYRNEIAEKARLINDYDKGGEHDQMSQDFQKLDAMYQVLAEEMKSHPSQKVKDAMILNLLVRVDLLNQQLKKLEDRKTRTGTKAAEV